MALVVKAGHKWTCVCHVQCDCLWTESFAMGKLHKDIAMAMVQLAEEESTTDQDIIKVNAAEKLCC